MTFGCILEEKMGVNLYSTALAYALWFVGGFGALGFHRFYLGKTGTGILYLCTGGLGMVGAVFDFFTLANQVREANIRVQIREAMDLHGREGFLPRGMFNTRTDTKSKKESLEHAILRAAKKNAGYITPSDVALEADISLEEARKELDNLAKKGFADMRIRKSGVVVYCFPDFIIDKENADFENL
jgi:TM2 domain-containing membrane protein YozV